MKEKRQVRAAVRAGRLARVAMVPSPLPSQAFTASLSRLTRELGARRVSAFVSVNGEPATAGYLAWALEHGVEVLLPRVLADGALEWAVHQEGAFTAGAYGIPEPTGPASPVGAADNCDLMLIPAAAVDRAGTRLGWGKGFFDRELARIPTTASTQRPAVFAVVFEDEVFEKLPAEPHDVPVHGAVTEERIHHFG
ncbi:5-formyltetrahydrofolate cyclo-ligase [Leucobacter sp. BZR 635]